MAEDLQNLLDRIQADGVEKADARAAEIVKEAETKAAKIVADAESRSKDLVEKAEKDAEVFTDRSRKALEQAARDVILSVGAAVTRTMDRLVDDKVGETLSADVLEKMLVKLVEVYGETIADSKTVDLLVSEDDRERVTKFFMSELKKAVDAGLTIKSDGRVVGGFELSIVDGNVHHDFSRESVAEALCKLVRPRLAEIVRDAVAESK